MKIVYKYLSSQNINKKRGQKSEFTFHVLHSFLNYSHLD